MLDRTTMFRFVTAFALGIGLFGFSGGARADDAVDTAADTAPTTARAARLTFVQGAVTVDNADNTGSQDAQPNLPLLAGVRVATGDDGQAEIEFEDGSLARLTPNSALSLDTLAVKPGGDGGVGGVFTTSMSLLRGLAYLELRATPQYKYTLVAGGDALTPIENSTVRVNFDEPPAIFAVLDGTVHVAQQGATNSINSLREVRAGESLRRDTVDSDFYTITSEIAEDSWDGWNQDRDEAAANEAASRTGARDNYAGAQGYGWSDLDANGSWYDVPGQGEVWQPEVAATDAGFDPYGNGAWVYSSAGYVFASGYAWGWTPYRCGSWSYFGGFGWGWSPVVGCGGFGWGFGGVGRPVNILHWPSGYHVPLVPRPRPGPVRPIIPGRASTGWQMPLDGGAGGTRRERRINGVTVEPMEAVGSGYADRHEGRVGSSLQRDFPVDRSTHAAIVGRATTQPGVVHTESGWRPAGSNPSASRPMPGYRSPSGGAPVVRSAPPPRSAPAPAPQRSAPPPPPASHPAPAPAPAASHPR